MVAAGTNAQSQKVTVVDYSPAPGQFVNTMPEYEDGDTEQTMLDKCTEALNTDMLVCLGAYGGSLTVEFDHPVKNLRGSDLRICGNSYYSASAAEAAAYGGSFVLGIVYVGVGSDPATAQWYELAGWEYYTGEIHDFEITYHKPQAETGDHSLPGSLYDNYIYWEATWTEDGAPRDTTGYHMKNAMHRQCYWPLWKSADKITVKGGLLPGNAKFKSGNGGGAGWTLYRYDAEAYGYADASLNTDPYSTFDIDWAVDSEGNPVHLEEINYVKVMTYVLQHCTTIGETSTEVGQITDLHLVEGYDADPIVITQRAPPLASSQPNATEKTTTCIMI